MNTNEEDARILVEGGPFHRHVQRALAAITGVLIGGLLGTGGVALVALNAAHDAHQAAEAVRLGRVEAIRRNCREADERHQTAKRGLEILAARTAPPHPTHAQTVERRATLEAFVESLAPEYNCITRVREQLTP